MEEKGKNSKLWLGGLIGALIIFLSYHKYFFHFSFLTTGFLLGCSISYLIIKKEDENFYKDGGKFRDFLFGSFISACIIAIPWFVWVSEELIGYILIFLSIIAFIFAVIRSFIIKRKWIGIGAIIILIMGILLSILALQGIVEGLNMIG